MGNGYRSSSRIATGLSIAVNGLGFALAFIKIIADMKKHSTHDTHHQFCDCLGQCVQCSVQAALQRTRVTQGR